MRITESWLQRIIREALLTEAAITPGGAKIERLTFKVDITLRNIEIDVVKGHDDTAVVGQLFAGKIEESRSLDQKGVWAIYKSNSSISGLGPLMYDLMIDLIHPAALISDRLMVSKDAKRVWDYYMNNRDDVEALQLDNLEDELTPGFEDDNYDQNSAENWAFTDHQEWYDSSLSKAYRREGSGTPTLDALEGLGIIDIAKMKITESKLRRIIREALDETKEELVRQNDLNNDQLKKLLKLLDDADHHPEFSGYDLVKGQEQDARRRVVLNDDGEVVGFLTPRFDRGFWRAGAIYADPLIRGKGHMLHAIIEFFSDTQHRPARVWIADGNGPSQRAFTGAGFKKGARRDVGESAADKGHDYYLGVAEEAPEDA